MKIDIIIPNFNGSRLIKRNLPDVLKAVKNYQHVAITIVDDCSEESDKRHLREVIDTINFSSKIPVQLLEHEKNLGFSSTVNTGVDSSKADVVVLLNSDVSPTIDFLDDALSKIEQDDVFGVGCLEKSIEKGGVVLRGSGKGMWARGFLLHKEGDVTSEKTFWVSGGSAVLKRELYQKIGGMDRLYNPFYWEDIDLSYRAQKSGYKILFSNKSIVEHRHDEGAIKSNFKSEEIKKIAYRNQFIFVWKNITDTSLLVNHFFWLPIHLGSALIHGNTSFINAFFVAISMLPDIIVERKKQKKLYKFSDKKILESQ